MQRILGAAVALAFLIGVSGAVDAKQCRDAKGHFVKCKPATMNMMTKKPCRDAKGKFVKCTTTKM